MSKYIMCSFFHKSKKYSYKWEFEKNVAYALWWIVRYLRYSNIFRNVKKFWQEWEDCLIYKNIV
jgi:hypothetical protein